MTSIDLLNLPEHNLIDIFDHLDFKSLLRITETCQTFAEVFNSSTKLSRKVKVNIKPKSINDLKQSERKYRNAVVSKDVRIDDVSATELSKLQQVFSKLEELICYNGMSDSTKATTFSLSLLQNAVTLRRIKLMTEALVDADCDSFKRLLMNQKDLEDLELCSVDLSLLIPVEPPFQLKNLTIGTAIYANKDDLMAFLATQRSLRSIDLCLSSKSDQRNHWINHIFEGILFNEHLGTVSIALVGFANIFSRMHGRMEFLQLPTNMVCPSVIDLTFSNFIRFNERFCSASLEFVVKAFPNVRSFHLEQPERIQSVYNTISISSWSSLESLELLTEHENLKKFKVNSENFKKFRLTVTNAIRNYEFHQLRSSIGKFLKRHQTIRHLILEIKRYRRNARYPDIIDELVAENIPELETLSVSYSED